MRNATFVEFGLIPTILLIAASSARAQDWPQWRGPTRDNKIVGFTAPATWPKELAKKWQVKVGVGEASPVMVGDKIYAFGRLGGDEVITCLDANGKEIWHDKYPAALIKGPAGPFPGPRSTPAVGEGKVCVLGVHGVVSCLDAASGKLVWRKETAAKPTFFTSTSPLIVDGKCVVFTGGLTAYDLNTGETKWEWKGNAPYGSPALATVDGVKQVVSPAAGALVGVRLADGKPLWEIKVGGFAYQSHYSTPIIDGPMVYYSSSAGRGGKGGKGGGGASSFYALKIQKDGDTFTVAEVWKKPMAADGYHVPLLKDGMLFGVAGRNFFCVDAKTGDELWKDSTPRGECGSILDAGSVLLALTSDKQLVAFNASNKSFAQVAKYQVSDAETWCVPIVAGSRIFVKDKIGMLTLWSIQ